MKYIVKITALFLLFFNCLAVMETAKIKNGMSYNLNAEAIKLNPDETVWKVENQQKLSLAYAFRMARGFSMNGKFGLGIELGGEIGAVGYPSVAGVTEYNPSLDSYRIRYIPKDNKFLMVPRYFVKFGIMQNSRLSFAAKLNMGASGFSSGSLIASGTVGENEVYSALTMFNRYLKDTEKRIIEEGKGIYGCIGIERPTSFQIASGKKTLYNYIELGFSKNYWYSDKHSIVIAFGVSIK